MRFHDSVEGSPRDIYKNKKEINKKSYILRGVRDTRYECKMHRMRVQNTAWKKIMAGINNK